MVKEKTKTKKQRAHKKEEARNVSEQYVKGWIHVIRVHNPTHLAVTTTLQGCRCSWTTPHKERLSSLFKHQDYPPHSYIVKECYNSRNKNGKQRKETVTGKNRSLAQPQTLTQGGHEIASLLN